MVDWLSASIIPPELHASLGALALLVAYTFAPGTLGDPFRRHRRAPRTALVLFGVVVLLKEALWDPAYEVGQPFLWAGATDLAWYGVGILVMLAALWARFRQL